MSGVEQPFVVLSMEQADSSHHCIQTCLGSITNAKRPIRRIRNQLCFVKRYR